MKTNFFAERLAVCSWSLRPAHPQELIDRVRATGLQRIQLALDPLRENPQVWGETARLCREQRLSIVSGMFGCVGEDYSTLDSIRATGGLAPDESWEENWENIQATAELAQQLDLKLVSFHAGFLPHEELDPNYTKMHHRLTLVADLFSSKGIDLAFETGQETAATLLEFLNKLKRRNVGVNFDPANMILYDKGNPLQALRLLGSWLKQVHIKDARKTRQPGTWGEEVVVGTGEVPWPHFFRTLSELNFQGYCCIEREAGESRVEDIQKARQIVEQLA